MAFIRGKTMTHEGRQVEYYNSINGIICICSVLRSLIFCWGEEPLVFAGFCPKKYGFLSLEYFQYTEWKVFLLTLCGSCLLIRMCVQ
jgi:hypothetical protein